MKIGVKLRPTKTKGEHDPGHMGLYWKAEDGLEFRGFRFMIEDLPEDKQDASSWRDYLFENKVPGYIFDDIILQDDFHNRRDSLLAQNWTIRDDLEPSVLQETAPRQFSSYSFNPDTHHCHNCVTWTVDIVNQVVGQVLPRVREGRVKLMQAHLEKP